MGKKKTIEVGGGYAVRFDQRARGEETAFWVGVIIKDGKEVGRFRNSGDGAMTFVDPVEIKQAFQALVDEAGGSSLGSEREHIVILWAELKGYTEPNVPLSYIVKLYLREMAAQSRVVAP